MLYCLYVRALLDWRLYSEVIYIYILRRRCPGLGGDDDGDDGDDGDVGVGCRGISTGCSCTIFNLIARLYSTSLMPSPSILL